MKLSMYLLEAWFQSKGFKIQSSIREGDVCLVGARIAEKKEQTVKALACISAKDAAFGLVTICSAEDIIFVMNSSGDEVLNVTNEAFEYYNAWEASLLRGAFHGASLQDLLDEAHLAIMRPMLIKNSRMELCAFTDSYGPQIHPLWSEYQKQRKPSRIMWYDCGHAFNELTDVALQREPQIAYSPVYEGNFMYANLWSEDRRIGYISAYEYNRPFHTGDLQLMKVFQGIVNFYINAVPDVLFLHSALEEYLIAALEGAKPAKYRASDIYEINSWTPEDLFAMAVLKSREPLSRRAMDAALEALETNVYPMQAVIQPDNIVFLVNLREYGSYEKLEQDLRLYADKDHFVWGVSHEFRGIEDVRRQYAMAAAAAESACEKALPGMTMRSAGVTLLLKHLQTYQDLPSVLHPDYLTLKKYDEENNTQFAQTLFWYLYFNRSFMDAAVHMGVHRNTINYRMTKIFEILSSDAFDNVNCRILYLLSYLLEHPEE